MNIFAGLFIVVLLLFGAVFFSASETAITASSRVRLHHLAKNGNKRAKSVLQLQANIGRVISTILLANTWAITFMTAITTSIFTDLVGSEGTIYAASIMGALITIFVEVMPKIYVFSQAERSALFFFPLLKYLLIILSPLTVGIDWIARKTLRLFGVKHTETSHESTVEELRGAIDLHKSETGQTEHEQAMLRSILDLGQVEVSDIMTHRNEMFMVDVDLPHEQIVDVILKSPYTRVPLWKDQPDNIVGILHTKALLRAMHQKKFSLMDIAVKPWFIPESTTLFVQLQSFRERREHFALVVDEYGSLLGMLTLEDLMEEIVGEIVDEHDVEVPGIRRQGDAYIVNGRVTIRDLNRQLNWSLPDEKAATIAGLVLHESRSIPQVGEEFTFYNIKIEILRRHRHQLTILKLTPLQASLPESSEHEA